MSKTEIEKITAKDIGYGISDLELLIGLEKVMILSRELGGTQVKFPKDEGCETFKRLAALIGGDMVKKVAFHCGNNESMYIPMMSRFKTRMKHKRIIARYEELLRELGRTRAAADAVAREFEMSERTVRKIVNG